MDDSKEAEKWEHLEELHLWMKHVVGLMSNIINNGLGQAFFVMISQLLVFWILRLTGVLTALCSFAGSERDFSVEIELHSCERGGWEQISLLKDQLLESQEKLLKALKELTVAEEEKQKEAALTDAWKTLSDTNGRVSRAVEDPRVT
jgi:hypothetical protein